MLRATLILALALGATIGVAEKVSAQRMLGEAFASQAGREPLGRDLVVAHSTGFRFSIVPGLFIPFERGRVGFSIAGDVRYGFDVGYAVVAPGVRLAGFFPSGFSAFTGLGTLRVTFPVGPVGPYIAGGVGPGYVDSPSTFGAAYMVGGGLMVHFGRHFGVGVDATYMGISRTNFNALFLGPTLLIAF